MAAEDLGTAVVVVEELPPPSWDPRVDLRVGRAAAATGKLGRTSYVVRLVLLSFVVFDVVLKLNVLNVLNLIIN